MNKKEVEDLFYEEQFDDVLDTLLQNKVINKESYDYFIKWYYTAEDVDDLDLMKESFTERVIDKL